MISKIINRLRGAKHFAKLSLAQEIRDGEPEIKLIPVLSDPEGIFVDVGANIGVYAFYALDHFRQVVAVEAHPSLIRWLRRVLRPKGKVIHCALSDAPGIATLHVPIRSDKEILTRCSLQENANPGFALRAVEVPTKTVDELELGRVSFMKIDVEGHEMAVLRGATQTLLRDHPLCIVECEERHNAGGIEEVFRFFSSLGYESYFLHRGKLCKGNDFSVPTFQKLENAKSADGDRSLDYINNFIFIPVTDDLSRDKINKSLS